jgi:hypothetical protein
MFVIYLIGCQHVSMTSNALFPDKTGCKEEIKRSTASGYTPTTGGTEVTGSSSGSPEGSEVSPLLSFVVIPIQDVFYVVLANLSDQKPGILVLNKLPIVRNGPGGVIATVLDPEGKKVDRTPLMETAMAYEFDYSLLKPHSIVGTVNTIKDICRIYQIRPGISYRMRLEYTMVEKRDGHVEYLYNIESNWVDVQLKDNCE